MIIYYYINNRVNEEDPPDVYNGNEGFFLNVNVGINTYIPINTVPNRLKGENYKEIENPKRNLKSICK